MSLSTLSDEALLASLNAICSDERHLVARQLLQLVEVEDRRLELRTACSSMFDFCTRRLGMSESIAFRRLTAARLARRFPMVIGAIERGEIHLCGLVALKDILTDENVTELLAQAVGKSTRHLEALAKQGKVTAANAAPPPLLAAASSNPSVPTSSAVSANSGGRALEAPPARPAPPTEVRTHVELSVTAALEAKLQRALDLMRHGVPNGDLAVVVERAVDLLIAKLEKDRLGKTSRPQRNPRPTNPGRIARSVRREVFERDGEQCTFSAEGGERCPARTLLELDHIEARALGGSDDAANLRVRCRAHNRLHAEQVFGAAHVKRRIAERQRASRRARQVQQPPTPTQAPKADAAQAELCIKGLANMGFAESKAKRAVALVVERRATSGRAPSLEELLREALTELT